MFEQGKFYVGCNYWASKSGVYMWSNWDAENVENDFKLLAEAKMKAIRVFPMWTDFQPVNAVYGFREWVAGYSIDGGQTLLPINDSGMSEIMLNRFEQMLQLAEKYNLQVIPSLLTGWMSGRLFVPPLLEGRNLIGDPLAIKWEIRFVKAFVERFKHNKMISAWCLGNECNCMSEAESREHAWQWISSITNAIKSVDNTRPVISGMHSQYTVPENKWVVQDCAESCDILTTHPYASPSYKTDEDYTASIKPMLHPAAQTLYVEGLGGKPCFIEETGTYGEMYCDEQLVAKYAKGALQTAWAHDCLSYLWWIGFDQGHLTYHPFGFNNRASNYGLYRQDKTLKPIGETLRDFSAFLETFPEEKLPKRMVDGVCILSGNNTWPSACSAFILAKQAGIELEFAYVNEKLPDAKAYFIPSLDNQESFGVHYLNQIMEKVKQGAVLYLSVGKGVLRNMSTDFGFHITHRLKTEGVQTVTLHGESMPIGSVVTYKTDLQTAECLAQNEQGDAVFTRSDYGKGKVFFLGCPLETYLHEKVGVFQNTPYYKIYGEVAKCIQNDKALSSHCTMIGITEHPINEDERYAVLIGYDQVGDVSVSVAEGWQLDGCYMGNATLAGNTLKTHIDLSEAVVIKLKRN